MEFNIYAYDAYFNTICKIALLSADNTWQKDEAGGFWTRYRGFGV